MKRYREAGSKVGTLRNIRAPRNVGMIYFPSQTYIDGIRIPSSAIREVLEEEGSVPMQVVDKDLDGVYTDIYANPPITDPADAERVGKLISELIGHKLATFEGTPPQENQMRTFIPLR